MREHHIMVWLAHTLTQGGVKKKRMFCLLPLWFFFKQDEFGCFLAWCASFISIPETNEIY